MLGPWCSGAQGMREDAGYGSSLCACCSAGVRKGPPHQGPLHLRGVDFFHDKVGEINITEVQCVVMRSSWNGAPSQHVDDAGARTGDRT